MKETLRVINDMQKAGVIAKYAVGGAIGATFYLEPVSTVDIDVFISFQTAGSGRIISIDPIFQYLKSRGYFAKGEHVAIADELVQFLPTGDKLTEEALEQAVEVVVFDTPSRVMTAEHLMAIALQLGRAKDFARIEQFVEIGAYDEAKLVSILGRHQLLEKWMSYKKRRTGGTP